MWKKAKKLPGHGNLARRAAFIEQLRPLLDGAQRDQHLLVYLNGAHIHQDVDLGYGWDERGKHFHAASASPGLSAKVSFCALYLFNEGQGPIWSCVYANGAYTIDVLGRLRVEFSDCKLIMIWDGAAYHRTKAMWSAAASLGIHLMALSGYSPDLLPVEPLWRWLREEVTYHHGHATAEDLIRHVAAFEKPANQDPYVVADLGIRLISIQRRETTVLWLDGV